VEIDRENVQSRVNGRERMVGRVGDSGDSSSMSSAEKKMYKSEFKHAADLFERTLDADTKSDNMYQKDEYRQVMEKSVQVLKETAAALNQDNLLKQADQIEKDLNAYQQSATPASIFQLHQDLEKAKKI